MLRDADGQLRGHLSDGTVDDWRESLVACGGKLHLVGYLWEATGLCVCACVCVNSASPHPTKLCQTQGGLMWHIFPSFGDNVAAGWEKLLGWDSFPLQGVLQARTVHEWGDDKVDWHLLLTDQSDTTVPKRFALCKLKEYKSSLSSKIKTQDLNIARSAVGWVNFTLFFRQFFSVYLQILSWNS